MKKSINQPIAISIISDNGLTKEVYEFECIHTTLKYNGYHCYHRSTVHNLWADEWDDPKSYLEWCKDNKIDPCMLDYDDHGRDNYGFYYPKYESYINSLNGVMCKTIRNEPCAFGMAGYNLEKAHPLPEKVKKDIKKIFINMITVEGENYHEQ